MIATAVEERRYIVERLSADTIWPLAFQGPHDEEEYDEIYRYDEGRGRKHGGVEWNTSEYTAVLRKRRKLV